MTEKSNNAERGFTLIEVLVIIAIMAVLASVAVASYVSLLRSAENNLALANINIIRKYVTCTIAGDDFTNEEKFTYIPNKPNIDQDANYLSRYIEITWEYLGESGDEDNANYINIENPDSEKVGIVNWSNVVSLCNGHPLYRQQALYISDSSYLSYTPLSPQTFDRNYFNNALIMWYDDTIADHIYFYYVDQNGTQSEEYFVLTNPESE